MLDEVRDETLAGRAASGDLTAFEALVNRHRRSVYRLAWSVTGSHADADDAAQETFLRVHRALVSYDPGRPFAAWLRTIAWNTSLNVRRSARSGVLTVSDEDLPDPPDPAPGPEEEVQAREEGARVREALASLSPELRAVLILRAAEGLSYREIARTAGIRLGTVMSRLSRARERLAAALDPSSRGGPR